MLYICCSRNCKSMVFPVVMYGCESWTVKKAERQRIDAFELWCWRRLLRVPWIARRSNQSILKEINPGISLEGMMLKLKLQYLATSELTHWKRLWCWEGLGAGGNGDDRGWDGWMESLTRWTWVWVNSGSWWWTGKPGVLWFMGSQRVGHDWVTELNWSYQLLWVSSRCAIAGTYGENMFTILRNCQTVFQRSCTIFHYHQKGKFLVLHPYQHLLLQGSRFGHTSRFVLVSHSCFDMNFRNFIEV